MNTHDRYFAAQRISLAPRATGARLPARRARHSLRAFTLGVAIGAALSWLAMDARAAPSLLPAGGFEARACEVEAMTARHMAESRDAGTPEARWHERLDGVARTHPELALTPGDIRREHAAIAEVWALRHLAPDTMFAFVLHRCLFGRAQS